MCRPEATPGSREWDHRGDLAARALQQIAAGYVDEHGVAGLASGLHVSERHLNRVLMGEVGAGAARLARSRRAQTARLLIDQTSLSLTDVAFAAGFASVRQFNDVMREEFGVVPSALRRTHPDDDRSSNDGSLVLRLRLREPYAGASLARWFAAHAVPGTEQGADGEFAQVIRTAHGPSIVRARPEHGHLAVRLSLSSLADLSTTVAGLRRTWDLDTDPAAVDQALSADPLLAPMVAQRPGLRVPGAFDGFEVAVRTILGQQVSVAAAKTFAARLVQRLGEPLTNPVGELTHAFPTPEALVEADLSDLGFVRTRAEAVRAVAAARAGGLRLEPGVDRDETRRRLLALPGIGPWTADYIALRALADPDAWMPTDLIVRRAVASRNADPERWRPWRAYAALHLWTNDALETA